MGSVDFVTRDFILICSEIAGCSFIPYMRYESNKSASLGDSAKYISFRDRSFFMSMGGGGGGGLVGFRGSTTRKKWH